MKLKYFLIVACLSMVAALTSVSCEKDTVGQGVSPEEITVMKRLSFDSETEFYEALQMFSDTEDRVFEYERDIRPWEKGAEFTSMRGDYEELLQKFEALSSEKDVAEFAKAHPHWVSFSNEGYQIEPPMGLSLMNLLAPDGTVEIAGALYKYTPSKIHIILDGDESKLARAVDLGTSDESNGVYVISDWRKTELDLRSCNQAKALGCTSSPEVNQKRVKGNWEVQLGAFAHRDVYGQVLGWTISYYWDIRIKGEKRNIFNNWKTNKTRLGFTSGFGVFSSLFGTTNSGTGWVTNSDVSGINHTFRIQGPLYSQGFQLPLGFGNFYMTYCTCGAKDANVPPSGGHNGIYCYDCCPWDCSDLDWNSIQ